MRYSQKTILTLFFLICISRLATAETADVEDFSICKPLTEVAPPRPQLPPSEGNAVRLFADQAVVQEKQAISTFSGDVLLQRGDQILKSRILNYNRNTEIVDTQSDFIFWDPNFIISGSNIQLRPNHQGEMGEANYWLLSRRARGHAEKIIKESKDIVSLKETSYTTCDPRNEVWRLSASQVILDNATETGTAYDVTVNVANVPVLYTPYLSFPIGDARKSGFLTPSVGSSDETGLEFSIPYYLNLAPHYDATLTPRVMTRRGLLLTTEFRYLTAHTNGTVKAEYMPHDQAFGADRSSLSMQHRGPITDRWYTDLNINYASDNLYFEQLGNNISVASISHLERREELAYLGDSWTLLGRLQSFQTLDRNPLARPYQRLPQLLFNTWWPEGNRTLNANMQAEYVYFDRDTHVIAGPIGHRLDLKSIFSYPWRTPGTFVVPKLSLRYTLYDLDNVTSSEERRPDRLLFTVSTDSGLFWEREVTFLQETELLQTLEPRLFYRYTPYHNQSDLPVFDTAQYDWSFGQLFRDNNFSGADRVDDGHQITLALTSRLLGNTTGLEHWRTSVGQTYYFRDRQVTLPNQSLETDPSSPIIFEVATQPVTSWTGTATVIWDPNHQDTKKTVLRTRYHPHSEHILNLSYRLRDNVLEQTDVSWHWPLGRRWKMLGRWNLSLPDETMLETFGGLEYNSCCWAVRGIARRYLNTVNGENYLNGFFLQFELKGLGGVGKKADTFLEQSIPGYHDSF